MIPKALGVLLISLEQTLFSATRKLGQRLTERVQTKKLRKLNDTCLTIFGGILLILKGRKVAQRQLNINLHGG